MGFLYPCFQMLPFVFVESIRLFRGLCCLCFLGVCMGVHSAILFRIVRAFLYLCSGAGQRSAVGGFRGSHWIGMEPNEDGVSSLSDPVLLRNPLHPSSSFSYTSFPLSPHLYTL